MIISPGDTVKVSDSITSLRLGVLEGWWSQGMLPYCGLVGEVKDVYSNKVRVEFNDHSTWWYNVTCLQLNTKTESSRRGSDSSEEDYLNWINENKKNNSTPTSSRRQSNSSEKDYLEWIDQIESSEEEQPTPSFHIERRSSNTSEEEYIQWITSSDEFEQQQQQPDSVMSRSESSYTDDVPEDNRSTKEEYPKWKPSFRDCHNNSITDSIAKSKEQYDAYTDALALKGSAENELFPALPSSIVVCPTQQNVKFLTNIFDS